ncbi:MAG: ABC transporter substrate-binding protein, partial [Lachnospiraceae bacterium]|nr:ABC transporter substrate-binding protein [Lachnospiraceae bacterium]
MKNKFFKSMALLLAAVMTLGALSGCGRKDNPADNSTAELSSSENQASDEVTQANAMTESVKNENAADDAETVHRDVVNVGIEGDPGELSPFGPTNTGRKDTLNNIYQGLAHVINGEIVGVLFDEYEWGGEDEHPYFEMHLYDYIYDSAGNHLTANDVKFSLETGKALGNLADLGIVESVEVVDDYTVRFYFNHALYLNDIENVFNNLLVVTQAAYEASGDGMATMPVSTSHYKVKEYTPGYCLTLVENENYWQTDESLIADRDKANVSEINFFILTETSQMSLALENSSIDMSWTVSTDDISRFTSTDAYWLFQATDDLCDYVLCNVTEGLPTADVNLRKAIFYAINSEAVIQSVYGGSAFVMYDMAAQKAPDAQESWINEENYYKYDPEKAKECLELWGGDPSSLKLKILGANDTSTANELQLLQGFLSAVGITSEVVAYDRAQVNTG